MYGSKAGWIFVCTLGLALGSALPSSNHVDPQHARNGLTVGFLPTLGDSFGSLGVGLDSNTVNAGVVAIFLTAAAILTVLLLPGLSFSYGGQLLSETLQSRQFLDLGTKLVDNAVESRQLGLNGAGGVGLMTLFSVAMDVYSKMETDDVTCQKKVICEFMKDKNMFGTGASNVRSGIQYATGILKNFNVPYVNEIREAASLNDQSGRSCGELHPSCTNVSLKESYDKSVKKVFNITEPKEPAKVEAAKEDAEDETEYEYYYEK